MKNVDRTKAPEVYELTMPKLPALKTYRLPSGIEMNVLTRDRGQESCPQSRLTGSKSGICRISLMLLHPGGTQDIVAEREMLRMLSRGSQLWPGKRLSDVLAINGTKTQIGCNSYNTTVAWDVLNARFDNVIRPIRDMIVQPKFSRPTYAVLRRKSVSNAMKIMEQVTFLALVELHKMLYGNDCPLAKLPTPDNVRAVTLDGIRRQWFSSLQPENMRLFIAGDVTPEIEQKLAEAFSDMPAPTEGTCQAKTRKCAPLTPEVMSVAVPRDSSLQSAVLAAIPTPVKCFTEDHLRLQMATTLLGGFFGSRLCRNIREEKGLTYGIGTFADNVFDTTDIKIYTNCKRGTGPQVIDEIRSELRRLADPATYTATEVDNLRRFILTVYANYFETPLSLSDFIQTQISRTGSNRAAWHIRTASRLLRELSPESLAHAASLWLNPDALVTATVG